jgi:hypothetical protein
MAEPVTGSAEPVHTLPEKSPRNVKNNCIEHHRIVDLPAKNNGFRTLQRSAGSKEPVSTHMFQSLEPVRNLLQVPRNLRIFREALGETQGYGLRPVLY